MIKAEFSKRGGNIRSVSISGHAGFADAGQDIVCAAVTSAVELCECAINDVLSAGAGVSVDETNARISLELPDEMKEETRSAAQAMLSALELHLRAIEQEYPKCILVLEV